MAFMTFMAFGMAFMTFMAFGMVEDWKATLECLISQAVCMHACMHAYMHMRPRETSVDRLDG